MAACKEKIKEREGVEKTKKIENKEVNRIFAKVKTNKKKHRRNREIYDEEKEKKKQTYVLEMDV